MTTAIETALTELSANLRRMEQRHQAVGYKFDRLYGLIDAAREELVTLTEPSMFWDAEDPESCQTSVNNVVVNADSYRGLEVGDLVEVQRAVRLPNVMLKITEVPSQDGDYEWEEVTP